ncbi:hypothetical protein HI914_03880 [Erysiphe necator]|nr:hypothetical protein HI914_03880 [Erysiphe necator]
MSKKSCLIRSKENENKPWDPHSRFLCRGNTVDTFFEILLIVILHVILRATFINQLKRGCKYGGFYGSQSL